MTLDDAPQGVISLVMTILIYALLLGPLAITALMRRSLPAHYLALAVGFAAALATTLTLTYCWNNGALLGLRDALVRTLESSDTFWYVIPNAIPMLWPLLTFGTIAFVTRLAKAYGWQWQQLDWALLWITTLLILSAPIISRTAFRLRSSGRYEDYPDTVMQVQIVTTIVYVFVGVCVLTAAIRALLGIPKTQKPT